MEDQRVPLPRSFLRPTGRSQAIKHIDTVWAYYTGNPDATKPDPMCDDNIAFHIDNWATYTTAQYHPTISSFLRMTLAETLNDAVVSSSCWLQSQRCSHKCASTCTSTLCNSGSRCTQGPLQMCAIALLAPRAQVATYPGRDLRL